MKLSHFLTWGANVPVILVLGGSLGAGSINNSLSDTI